ncbi:discoidin domain-containing protein [Microbispora sp. H13382]|uniref:discoidin domain-containing protein n=1 Tax=Microbispora sp. H13382 TaxID=2729112 RepID=UPI0015FF0357|nr:discoidin domain-containing protein [Microbispora sp. H13382]
MSKTHVPLSRLIAVVVAACLLAVAAPLSPASAAGGPNLAAGRPVTASSTNGPYVAGNLNDGDQGTYWESAGSAFPQWAQVDLGGARSIDQVVLKLPATWEGRTLTLSVQGSTDGSGFAAIAGSAGRSFAPGSGNTVTIGFAATTTRYVRINITANTGWPAAQLSEIEVYGAAAATGNLALGKTMRESAHADVYGAGNANDGNQGTYWESANNAFPQWLQVDLGAPAAVGKVVLKLPPAWEARTQTLAVQGGTDGTNFSTLAASAGHAFTPASGNTVTITFSTANVRYVRLTVTANTAWPAGQIAEFEVYGSAPTGDTQAPTAPSNLAYTETTPGQVKLTWTASTDNVGVTGYDVYANNVLRGSVAGNITTYTDTQPGSATVTYHVRAKDAAGNESADSNAVTRNGSGGGSNMAVGKPITASSSTFTYVAANANDNDLATYWEGAGGSYPQTLTLQLGSNAVVSSVVLKLDPAAAWSTRTQTVQVLGREQSASGFTTLTGAATYTFNPATGNTVTIPASGTVADVQLRFTANSGAPAGQVAEFQVIGTPAPNPDLTVTALSASPASPAETDAVTLSATVRNAGSLGSAATTVNFYLDGAKAGTAPVGALAAGASATVTADIGRRDAGSYALSAKVDESNAVIEQNETNNSFTASSPLVVKPVDSSDLVASPVSWSPGNPAGGSPVTFTVAIKNQGTVASAGGAHGITLAIVNDAGTVVRTLTGSYSGAIAAGATTSPVNLGTWTAVNGRYTVKTVLAADANELPVKQANNTSSLPFFAGRGANMPYDMYEAEDGVTGGGATVVGPNRTIGDLAGEASGRRAVRLTTTGSYVEWTTKASTNTLVTRFSIPDAPGGGGTDATLNVYVDGTFLKAVNLTSKYAWLYGDEKAPGNSPGAGGPRHIYDEANVMLGTTVPAGSKIRLQKDAANTSTYAIDFVNLEQVSAIPNPDPATYAVPAGFTHQDVQNALDKVRMDTTGKLVGVYLPPGDYQTSSKFQVYGKAVKVAGAGPWFTRFHAPSTQENTDIGFRAESSANGSVFSGFAYFGNYTTRIDGPGKVFDWQNVANMTIDNIWVEHQVCMYWGANTDNITIKNSRIRDTFADGVNMTNGSTDNLVSNIEARTTGDDSFALFSAIDAGGADEKNNVYENLTAILPWRAAGIAVYGGYANTFRNIYIADTLTYSGITISSLDFGYPMNGFGASPPTVFDNISIVRAGGHFWGQQTFPAIWVFSASKVFQGIRVSNVDIVDPTYSGIMFQTNYDNGRPQNPIKDTVFTNVSISGAHRSGDAFDAKSGFGLWANEMPEPNQGPAVGSVTFNNLRLSDNYQDVRNTTSTFTIDIKP